MSKILPVDFNKPEIITSETQMSSWFGKDKTGKDVMIDEGTLIDIIEEYFPVKQDLFGNNSDDYVAHCRKYDWVVLPDETRLVCSLRGALEQKWDDIYVTLKKAIDNHNSKV